MFVLTSILTMLRQCVLSAQMMTKSSPAMPKIASIQVQAACVPDAPFSKQRQGLSS